MQKLFGPQEIWSLRNLGPEKFGPEKFGALMEVIIFMMGPNFLGPKFLRDQISWGAKVRGPNEIEDHFIYHQLRLHVVKNTSYG